MKRTKDKYPDVLTPEKRRKYEAAMAEIRSDMKRIHKECEDSQRITAKDLSIVINAR